MILQPACPVEDVHEVGDNTFVLSFRSAEIADAILPGQFVNIKSHDDIEPLLRRPFSVYWTEGDRVDIIFQVVGKGTGVLRRRRAGDLLNVLGPLGKPFDIDGNGYETAILVGGGLGVAPLPTLTRAIQKQGRSIITLLGARTGGQLVNDHLVNLRHATDDGSAGLHGTVVDLLAGLLSTEQLPEPKLFACGPTAMLRALAAVAAKEEIPCEVSLEGPMACGFGICQGCPVESVDGGYLLMCKDGPAFDIRTIRI